MPRKNVFHSLKLLSVKKANLMKKKLKYDKQIMKIKIFGKITLSILIDWSLIFFILLAKQRQILKYC